MFFLLNADKLLRPLWRNWINWSEKSHPSLQNLLFHMWSGRCESCALRALTQPCGGTLVGQPHSQWHWRGWMNSLPGTCRKCTIDEWNRNSSAEGWKKKLSFNRYHVLLAIPHHQVCTIHKMTVEDHNILCPVKFPTEVLSSWTLKVSYYANFQSILGVY